MISRLRSCSEQPRTDIRFVNKFANQHQKSCQKYVLIAGFEYTYFRRCVNKFANHPQNTGKCVCKFANRYQINAGSCDARETSSSLRDDDDVLCWTSSSPILFFRFRSSKLSFKFEALRGCSARLPSQPSPGYHLTLGFQQACTRIIYAVSTVQSLWSGPIFCSLINQ